MGTHLSETVPAALRAELARRGILRYKFAAQMGKEQKWVYRRLVGEVDMTLRDLDDMAEALDTTSDQIVAAACGRRVSAGPDRSNGQSPLNPTSLDERNGS